MFRQPFVLILLLDFSADLVFRTNSPIACDDNLFKCEEPIPELREGAHVFILHDGEFLQFILAVVNMDFEYIVGLLLDFFFPLVPSRR